MSLVEAGSEYETKDKNGISHFLEHMFFKGTLKRPTSLDIAKEFGAKVISIESRDFTFGYALNIGCEATYCKYLVFVLTLLCLHCNLQIQCLN
mgnify:CR=1 FL=1